MTAKLIPVALWSTARYDPPISLSTLRRWCSTGKIPGAVRTGRNWRVPSDAEYCAHPAQAPHEIPLLEIPLLDLIYGKRA